MPTTTRCALQEESSEHPSQCEVLGSGTAAGGLTFEGAAQRPGRTCRRLGEPGLIAGVPHRQCGAWCPPWQSRTRGSCARLPIPAGICRSSVAQVWRSPLASAIWRFTGNNTEGLIEAVKVSATGCCCRECLQEARTIKLVRLWAPGWTLRLGLSAPLGMGHQPALHHQPFWPTPE